MTDFSQCKPGDLILTKKGGVVVVVGRAIGDRIFARGNFGEGIWMSNGDPAGPNARANYGSLARVLDPGDDAESTVTTGDPVTLTLRQQYKMAVVQGFLAACAVEGIRLPRPVEVKKYVGEIADALIEEDAEHGKGGR